MSYKDEIQQIADELASERYDKDFYNLSDKQQDEIYEQAQEQYIDHYTSLADSMEGRRKEINHE